MKNVIVRLGMIGFLAAQSVRVDAATAPQGFRFGPGSGGPVVDPYPLYPSLDLAQIPWHVGAGAWGPQVPLQAPALPVTTRNVTVNTMGEFNTQAAIPGTRITIGTGWAGSSVVTIAASDIDVILPAGISIGAVEIGNWPRTTLYERLRIRGSLDGSRGGRMGQFRTMSAAPYIPTDVVIEGIDMNGDSGYGGGETNQAFRADVVRIAVINCRIISGGYTWLGNAKQVVIANCNFFHGAATRASMGYSEGWGIRNANGPFTIVDSRIQGTRYHNIRMQSNGHTEELLYVVRSTLVGAAEGRTAWMWANLNNDIGQPGYPWYGEGGIIEDSDIYSYSAPGCVFGQEISAFNVTYSRVRNNRFYGGGNAVFTQAYLNAQAAAGATPPGDHDWSVGNTFQPLSGLPAWGGPGDPTAVPLPSGLTLDTAGESPCFSY